MAEQFVCKVASVEEMHRKWDYEITHSGEDRANWIVWKQRHIEYYLKGYSLPYYGILDGQIICEATAMLHPSVVQNSDGLVGSHTVYLSAFRTIETYQGKGYFSKLFRFMLDDLRQRGYTRATLGVEPWDETNKRIYAQYGFTAFIKSGKERYPDGSEIDVEYYGRDFETEKGCTGKVIAACGNDCSACPRYTAHPYEKTEEELAHTAELWMKIGYRDHICTNEEISCSGCKPENWCRYRVVGCCAERGITTCADCQSYPCKNLEECFAVTASFAPACRRVCTEDEYESLRRAFFEKARNLMDLGSLRQETTE